jgi:hypothetical protein
MGFRKRLEVSDVMLDQIERVTGTTVAASDIVVYEAAALSTKPLSQPGSIYDGARLSQATLMDMARSVRSGENNVPLHTLHRQGVELPVGKVFDATVVTESDGSSVLMAQFYIPASEKDLVNKIDLAVLDEVSVGLKSRQASCSKCGFDFFNVSPDDEGVIGYDYLWDRTCPNNHTLGRDGTHLVLNGLENWTEMSLVSRGASNKPKIRSRKEPQPGVPEHIAANHGASDFMLFTQTPPPMENNQTMDAETKATLEALMAKITGIETTLAATPEHSSDPVPLPLPLPHVATEAELAETQAALATAKAELEAALNQLANREVVILVEPPVGGVAASAIADAKGDYSQLQASAFKTKPRH